VNWTLKLKTYIAIIVDIGGLEKKPMRAGHSRPPLKFKLEREIASI
jgi:hypothetical protein